MGFSFDFTDTFKSDLKKLDRSIKRRLEKVLRKIKQDPTHSKHLIGYTNRFRVRLRSYRLVYDVEGDTIHLIYIKKRDDVYRNI